MKKQLDLSLNDYLSLLPNTKLGTKNHLIGDCVFCGKKGHMYFNVVKGLGDCKKCGTQFNAFLLLKQIGRLDLIDFGKSLDLNQISTRIELLNEKEELRELPTITLPSGSKRVFQNDYLDSRGFDEDDYFKYKIYINKVYKKYEKYVFITFEEKGELKGYLGRSIHSKEEIKEIEANGGFALRYRNSDTEFSLLLSGSEEIVEGVTKTVIVVEGFTDKHNIDKKLLLDNSDELKCVCSFGKKLSDEQIKKLINKGIENIIILYDGDAISTIKDYSLKLQKTFNVLAGFIPNLKDPGELSLEEIEQIFSELKNPVDYCISYIQPPRLK